MVKLKTVDIQGKAYVTVNERIRYFRENHADFSLRTELVLVDETQALVKAIIRDEQDRIVAEGTAFEKAGSSFINKGSHVENAETSAWGRALGNFGIGIDASVASADEVATAVMNKDRPILTREETNKCSTGDVVTITKLCKETGTDIVKLYTHFKISGAPTKEQAAAMITALNKKLNEQLNAASAK